MSFPIRRRETAVDWNESRDTVGIESRDETDIVLDDGIIRAVWCFPGGPHTSTSDAMEVK